MLRDARTGCFASEADAVARTIYRTPAEVEQVIGHLAVEQMWANQIAGPGRARRLPEASRAPLPGAQAAAAAAASWAGHLTNTHTATMAAMERRDTIQNVLL